MSNKKFIPLPQNSAKAKKYNYCNCKLKLENCNWPSCICEECLQFTIDCVCKTNERK